MRLKSLLILGFCLFLSACNMNPTGQEPPSVVSLIEEGHALEAQGNKDEALNRYQKALSLSTTSTAPHVAIARLLRSDRRNEDALEVLNAAKARKANDADVLNEIGFAYTAMNENMEALKAFDAALAINPSQVESYSGKGVVLDLQGKHSEAQALYKHALDNDLESPALKNNYAMSLILTGNTKQAIQLLEPLVASKYATSSMRQNLALAYGLRGNSARAMELGLKDLNPNQARENLEMYKRLADSSAMVKASSNKESGKGKTSQAAPVEPIVTKATTPTKAPVEIKRGDTTATKDTKQSKATASAKSTKPEAKKTDKATNKSAVKPDVKPATKTTTPTKPQTKAPAKTTEKPLVSKDDAEDVTVVEETEKSEAPAEKSVSDKGLLEKIANWEPDAPAKE